MKLKDVELHLVKKIDLHGHVFWNIQYNLDLSDMGNIELPYNLVKNQYFMIHLIYVVEKLETYRKASTIRGVI